MFLEAGLSLEHLLQNAWLPHASDCVQVVTVKKRYEVGLEKLATTESSVADMQQELIALQPQLEVSTKETEAAMVVSYPSSAFSRSQICWCHYIMCSLRSSQRCLSYTCAAAWLLMLAVWQILYRKASSMPSKLQVTLAKKQGSEQACQDAAYQNGRSSGP